MDNTLRIALWNANGLTQHRQEVELFLKCEKIDILLITETHFTDKSYFKINNYTCYSTLHPDGTAHGGTAVIIRNKIKHFEIEEFAETYLQATCIKIHTAQGTLVVAAVYCPPKYNLKQDQFQAYFKSLGHRFISGGDYNAKHTIWGSRLITPKGTQLKNAMSSEGYNYVSTGEPTYWPTDPNKLPDLLDFFVTNGISSNYIDVNSYFDLLSDHSAVIATLSTTIIKNSNPMLTNNRTDWNMFKTYLEEKTIIQVPLKTEDNINSAINQLTENIHFAAKKSTPVQNKNDNVMNYPKFVRDKISEKRNARRVWQHSRHPSDKNRLNKLTKDLTKLLYKIKSDTFQEYTRNLSSTAQNDYSLWKSTKKLKRPIQPVPPLQKEDGTWARSSKEKAEMFANHLSKVFQPFPCTINAEEDNHIAEYLDTPLQLSLPIKYFTPGEVKEEIKFLNSKKAPGHDLITPRIIKELPKKAITLLTQIFNAIVRIHYFPTQWKFAQIILIHKPGKPTKEVSSYRPISLLPAFSKIFEKLILKRLRPVIEENELIPNHQFGFRKQHSTIEQVHRVVNVIEKNLEERKVCTAAFLDVSQAFDRVWHVGLLHKIKKSLPDQYYHLFKSYLANRYFQVRYTDELSTQFKIEAGVPQGSVLGPTLYQIYTADLPSHETTIMATFADDTAIMSSHEDATVAANNLQLTLNNVQKWSDKWRIKINESKSTHVTFTNRRVICNPVTINNKPIPRADEAKYLGIHLDKRLTWKKHLTMKRKQLNIKIRRLYWLLGYKSQLSLNNKILVYKIILKPVWTYGIQLWGCAKNSNVNIIQRFQNKALRLIANAPWYVTNETIHRDLKIAKIKDEVVKFATRHVNRLSCHPNELALNLLNNEDETRRLQRKKPLDLMFV